jgi:hypothetical protein
LEFIKWNQEYVDHLNSFKKKDDLCDAYLHGVHYIQKNLEPAKPKGKKLQSESESELHEDSKPTKKTKVKTTLELDINTRPKIKRKTKNEV